MGPISSTETSVMSYHYSLRNSPEERSSWPLIKLFNDNVLLYFIQNTTVSLWENENVCVVCVCVWGVCVWGVCLRCVCLCVCMCACVSGVCLCLCMCACVCLVCVHVRVFVWCVCVCV